MQRSQDKRSISAQPRTIHGCAQSGDLNGLRKLLEDDPSLINEDSDPISGDAPLHIATFYNRRDTVKLLLEWQGPAKAKLELMNWHGETPLHVAASNGCSDIARLLINHGALVEVPTYYTKRKPLHLAVGYSLRTEDCSIVETLLELKADGNAVDLVKRTPLEYLPEGPASEKLRKLLLSRLEEQRKEKAIEACGKAKAIMEELEKELSSIVGLDELKSHLRNWAKGMVLDVMRRSLELNVNAQRAPHMVFLGNPGTGKTMVARMLGKLLKMAGILSADKVTVVQRTDLVGEHIGQTGMKTRRKIEEANGGILFVDEAYRLMPKAIRNDFGLEALEEIMSVMDSGRVVVIFAGYREPMERVISSNEGFHRRVTKIFHFDDFTSEELAKILFIKMSNQRQDSLLYGFKLHDTCTEDAVVELIQRETTEKQRREMNGGLVTTVLANARGNLNRRLALDCTDTDELTTITLKDLEAGFRLLEQ